MGPVIKAVDAGHIASGLESDGTHKSEAVVCKKDGEVWPCSVIRVARSKQGLQTRGAKA